MTIRARIDIDAVYQDQTTTSLTVGSLSDHLASAPLVAQAITATVGTSAVSISGPTSLSTLVIKNTGTTPLRLAGAINVTADRVAVLPTTATITIASPSGNGSYSVLWVG
jgi:hypothetical protein